MSGILKGIIKKNQTQIKALKETASKASRDYREGRLVENFSTLTQWNLQGGAERLEDKVNVKQGSASIRLNSVSGAATFIRKSGKTYDLTNGKMLKLRVFVHDKSTLKSISVYLANESGFTNFFNFVFQSTAMQDGWNELLINPLKGTKTGSPTFTTFPVMQVRVDPQTGASTSVTFDALYIDEKQRPKAIFTMDDGWITQYTEAFKRLDAKGFKATLAVIATKVGSDNTKYMTQAQLQEVYDAGWDLANHTNTHVHLGDETRAVQDSELRICYDYLMSKGWTRASDVIITPYGSFNSDTLDIIQNQYRASRSLIEELETAPPNNKNLLKIHNLVPNVTVASATGWIDDAIATGGTVIFLNHRFGDPAANGGDTMFYHPDNYQAIIDYLYSKKDEIDVVTVTEWLNGLGL